MPPASSLGGHLTVALACADPRGTRRPCATQPARLPGASAALARSCDRRRRPVMEWRSGSVRPAPGWDESGDADGQRETPSPLGPGRPWAR